MPDLLIMVIGLLAAGLVVLAPLRGRAEPANEDEREAFEVRHRVALEALRDVEADRRSGALDDATYAAQLADGEARAAHTRRALELPQDTRPMPVEGRSRHVAIAVAGVIGVLLIGGWAVPASGVANRTVVNRALASAEAAEEARQERIRELTDELAAAPDDPVVLSDLADALLADPTGADLPQAVFVLQALLVVDPERPDAYERMISAYLRAGDEENARAAHDAYAEQSFASSIELAFLDGLIARAAEDPARARAAFDRFLELAPDDPRAEMIRGMRDEVDGG